MSTDRPINLDVSTPNLGTSLGNQWTNSQPNARREPDAEAHNRFEETLSKPPVGAVEKPVSAPVPSPFSLFGAATAQAPIPMDTALSQQLVDGMERLMVGENGGRHVRMELKDELLPGVTVEIQETEGRLQVDFFCGVEASRHRLNAAAPEHAPRLASRLGRDVLLRVQTSDPGQPCLFEVAAHA